MKSIDPADTRLLLIIIIIWLNVTTFFITNLYIKMGEIEHTLLHTSSGKYKH
jgi:hypothetical protein